MNEMIKQLNENIYTFAHETNELKIETGKMGVCIYFFMLAHKLKNKQCRKWAENLLDEIYEQLGQDISVKSIFDIIQVGIGIDFLLKKKYVAGNINQALGDVDIALFQKMTSSKNPLMLTYETPGFLFILYYFYLRLEKQKLHSDNRFFMEELTIKSFNEVYASLNDAFYNEPVLFNLDYKLPPFLFVLSKIYSLKFYNYRIDEVIKEFAGLIQCRIPALHANRLYLLWGLSHLKQATGFTFWDEQVDIIYHNINIQKIFEQELRNKQVFIKDGIAGIYLLLAAMEKNGYKISYDPELFLKRMHNSEVWKKDSQQVFSFAHGISGLLLVEHLIYQKINVL